jgi:hypothetical protein
MGRSKNRGIPGATARISNPNAAMLTLSKIFKLTERQAWHRMRFDRGGNSSLAEHGITVFEVA